MTQVARGVTQVHLTLGWVADAVGGRLTGGERSTEVREIVIDSRAAAPGDLFVAIRGPRFDGHDFVGEVAARGAAAIVEAGAAAAGAAIEVRDTVRALQDLAHAVRVATGTTVVAITGSAGKTTTKETIAAFLERRYSVVRNKGNLNNHIGLPVSLLQVRTGPDVAVMELGMNHAGEISRLVAIAEPDVRVWTNVGDAHLGFFATPDAIADAKAEILENATRSTRLVCNADDVRVMAHAVRFAGRTITFGTSAAASVRAVEVRDLGVSGMAARMVTPHGTTDVETPLLGRGNLSNVLAAAAVAIELGVPLEDIADRAGRLRPSDHRGVVMRLGRGVTVIDDSYNSSPTALAQSLDVLAREQHAARRVAVLGEMLELGDHATRLHVESGRTAARSGVDLLYAIGGPAAAALAAAAVESGLRREAATYFATSDRAASAVAEAIRPGDLVLVKGSRGVRTDLVVDRLVAELS